MHSNNRSHILACLMYPLRTVTKLLLFPVLRHAMPCHEYCIALHALPFHLTFASYHPHTPIFGVHFGHVMSCHVIRKICQVAT